MFFESGNKLKSLELLKHEISKNHSDTCIKWFEILNAKISRRNTKTILTNKEEVFKNQFNKIEALDILNLMKNKEKYIKYE